MTAELNLCLWSLTATGREFQDVRRGFQPQSNTEAEAIRAPGALRELLKPSLLYRQRPREGPKSTLGYLESGAGVGADPGSQLGTSKSLSLINTAKLGGR